MMRRLLVAAVTVAAVAVTAPPAHAGGENCANPDDYAGPALGSLCYPIPPTSLVIIQSSGGIWKMRPFAESLDAGLAIDVRSGRCDAYPGAFCVNVTRQDLTPDTHGGWCYYRAGYTGVDIVLNDAYSVPGFRSYRRATAAHEFLHALGMRHHAGPGLMGDTSTQAISADEWRALTDWYVERGDE